MRDRMAHYVQSLQRSIVSGLSHMDSHPFRLDTWTRDDGRGHGLTAVLSEGAVFEKAGVAVTVLRGEMPASAAAQMRARGHARVDPSKGPIPFFVTGISMVLHPRNPHAPTVHLNYRYYELEPHADDPDRTPIWWFGGGCDLTPAYLYPEDARFFHRVIKNACDQHSTEFYPEFKRWCDDYFDNTHRGEKRGVGGIFFDDLCMMPGKVGASEREHQEALFAFVKECGNAFLPSYVPIVAQRAKQAYTKAEKRWQQLRRGRYVEFNLVHDRGTKFGLATPGARIESILMSLPLTARWEYRPEVFEGTREAELIKVLREPRDWIEADKKVV